MLGNAGEIVQLSSYEHWAAKKYDINKIKKVVIFFIMELV
tara:strand:+ start:1222 stop:1341 length:120 start_codon:yes stop_codon:yes gene_type:complete